MDLLAAVYRVRRHWFGNRVELNFLVNAKSGLCGEDCGYCSQSRVSKAEIPRYKLLSAQEILDGARLAAERKAKTYCTVISGRTPRDEELDLLAQAVPEAKAAYGLQICFSVGLLSLDQAQAAEGCRREPRQPQPQHPAGDSTRASAPHTVTTIDWQHCEAVRQAGLEICSGGIVRHGRGSLRCGRVGFDTWRA